MLLEKLNSAELYTEKARAYFGLKKFDECLNLSDKAISIDQGNPNAHNYRGNAWYGKKEYDKAAEDYTKAIQLNPDYVFHTVTVEMHGMGKKNMTKPLKIIPGLFN